MPGGDDALKKMRSDRSYLKGNITRLFNLCSTSDLNHETCAQLEAKRHRLEDCFNEYNQLNKEIYYLDNNDNEDYDASESKYLTCLATLNDHISKKTDQDSSKSHSPNMGHKTQTKLPTINIKSFNGKYCEYPDFKQLFYSLIHNDLNLDNIQKLHYLRSFLEGEPYGLIKCLPLTSEGYKEALSLLDNRYYNKYRIISDLVNCLLDLKPIQRSLPCHIREFIGNVKQNLAAIKNLDINISNWDPILMVIFQRKVDSYTLRAYHLEMDASLEPKVEDFINYLEHRALALENASPSAVAAKHQQGYKAVNIAAAKSTISCLYCLITAGAAAA